MKKLIVLGVLVSLFLTSFGNINQTLAVIDDDFGASNPGATDPGDAETWSVGQRIRTNVSGGAALLVEDQNGTDLGIQGAWSLGTVTGGPVFRGYKWFWNVNFDTGVDGWVNQARIVRFVPKFAIGDTAKISAVSLKIRSSPSVLTSTNILATFGQGRQGRVVGGPIYTGEVITGGTSGPVHGGHIWWKINWGRYCPNGITSCTDLIGWSAEANSIWTEIYLIKPGQPSNTNVPPPSAGGDFTLSQPSGGATYQRGTNLPVSWGTLPVYQYYAPVGLVAKLVGPYNDPTTAPTERIIVTKGSEVNPQNSSGGYTTGSSWLIASDVKDGLYVVKATADYSGNGSDRNSISGTFRISGTAPPGGNPTSTPTGQGSFSVPMGGESWVKGQTYAIRWNTPTAWNVNEVSLVLTDTNGNNLNSIAIVKDNIPVSIQGGGDFSWIIPTSVASGTYKIKATVNQSGTTVPNVILSNQFTIGNPIPGGGTNQSPVISRIDGPTSLNVGQSGTWTVSASDPNGDALTYEVTWGDGSAAPAGATAVLTHTFTVAGTYSLVFRVKDAGGLSAQYPFAVAVTAQSGGGPVVTGDRVVVTGNVNVRVEPNGYILGTQRNNVLYSGFAQFNPSKGVVTGGPQTVGGYTWVKVNYDYGPDGWSAVDYLSSLGRISGWEFTPDNILGRKIQPSQGSVFTEAYYYYVENGQVSIPSNFAQASLPPEALNIITGIQGGWNCQSISDATPFRWVGSRCSYRRGNQPPTIVSFIGPTSTFTNVSNIWQFTASDPEGALASYKIDWGDGSAVTPVSISGASVTQELSRTYVQTGTFNIKLTVTDGAGLSAEATLAVLVAAPCSVKFQNTDRVEVFGTGSEQGLNVRSSPVVPTVRDANRLGSHEDGSLGTVAGGPQSGSSYCWWNINYDSPPDGWSIENNLRKVGTSGGGDTSPQAGSVYNPGGTLEIRWVTPAGIDKVHIYLAGYGVIKLDALNTGYYARSIPANIRTGSDYQIIIYSADPDVSFQSVGPAFSILPGGGGTPTSTPGGTPNQPPMLDQFTAPTQATRNINTSWQIRATDREGASLMYTVNWGDNSTSTYTGTSGQTVSITHTYTSSGNKTITVTVSDGQLTSAPQTLTVNVVAGSSSTQGPSSQVSGPQTAVVGVANVWQIIAYDTDTASISFTVNCGDGILESFSNASGQPVMKSHTYSQSSLGQRTISVTATDGTSIHGSSWGINVATPEMATARPSVPTFVGPTQVIVGQNTTWIVTLRDPDTNSLTYTLNWNDGTPIVNGTATNGVPFTISHIYQTLFTGYKSVVIIVSDGNSTESGMVNILSKLPNQAPTADNISGPADGKAGVGKIWSITGTDPEGAVLSYNFNWGDGVNNNYTNKASGVRFFVDHTYAQPGNYTIQVIVTDNGGLSVSKSYSVRVNKFAVNDKVEVVPEATGGLTVRATPSPTGVAIGGVYPFSPTGVYTGGVYPLSKYGIKGTILEVPVVAGGYTWWKVTWDATMTGWSAENWLKIYSASSVNTVTIKVGQYAPLIVHPDLPPKGNPTKLSTFELNGRVWTWRAASNLWQFTSGPDLTIQY